jgi:hypothetical protein
MERRDRHIDAARTRLVHLGGLSERTDQAERRILDSARHRLEAVTSDLDKLRPRALLEDGAADRLLALTQEAGTLRTVIAQAQQHIGGDAA